MKIILFLILSAISAVGQGAAGMTTRNPASVALFTPFTSNQIYALSPKGWYMASIGVLNSAGNPCADGEAIKTWQDISANALHLSQDTSAARPKYLANQLNGYGTVNFRTSATYLTNEWGPSNSQPFYIFLVINLSNNVAGTTILTENYSTAGSKNHVYWTYSSALEFGIDGYIAAVLKSLPALNETIKQKWYAFDTKHESTRSHVFSRAQKKAFGDAGIRGWVRGLSLNKDQAAGNGSSGDIAEFIFFSQKHLDEHSRVGIELYLKKKYALPEPF